MANGQMPAIERRSVDLPQPEGPLTRSEVPLPMVKEVSLRSSAPAGEVISENET